MKQPIGIPPPIPLAIHRMSGVTPKVSIANSCPVLPKPVCISSKISSAPTSSQRFLRASNHFEDGTLNPVAP